MVSATPQKWIEKFKLPNFSNPGPEIQTRCEFIFGLRFLLSLIRSPALFWDEICTVALRLLEIYTVAIRLLENYTLPWDLLGNLQLCGGASGKYTATLRIRVPSETSNLTPTPGEPRSSPKYPSWGHSAEWFRPPLENGLKNLKSVAARLLRTT